MAPATKPAGLTDTDILIDAARGVQDAVAFLTTQQASGSIQISTISAMELIVGCRNKAELTKMQQFLQAVTILPVSAIISQTAYQLMESFYLSHGLLIPDALIAATAVEQGLVLFTKNTRHMQMIPSLTVYRPY